MNIKFIEGISPLTEIYEVFILDIWGVLMDGLQPYPAAPACLKKLREQKKKIVLLSNAPRQAHLVGEKLESIGITSSLYDHILSSGEATRLALSNRSVKFVEDLGNTYFYIGPDRDSGLLDGLDYKVSESLEKSDFILTTGPNDGSDRSGMYDKLLERAHHFGLPMICANPDHVVVRQTGERLLCAGALANSYERLGGRVIYFGKPYKEIYSILFDQLAEIPKQNIVAVGDTLETDIQGAQHFGLATTLVMGGVVAAELGVSSGRMPSLARLEKRCSQAGVMPTYAVPMFVW
jgi:HAD superfamily hydrolase (TIGR01459 family)